MFENKEQTMSKSPNRNRSFIIIGIIYLLASIVGIAVYRLMPFELWLNLLIADIAATVFVFIFSLIYSNASVYDPYWSVAPIVILYALFFGQSITLPKILLLIAVTFWGVRLTANWAYTFQGLEHQDWRYSMLHEQTGIFYPIINFIGIHLVPTLVVYGCVLPAAYVIRSDAGISPISFAYFFISIFAAVLQGTADIQMHKFRKRKTSTFIRDGLWKYSRHPNYLGEIMMWWGVSLFCCSVLGVHWQFVAGAIANTLLFLFVSIPLADGKQSKKEGFEEYKKQTRMLFPIRK